MMRQVHRMEVQMSPPQSASSRNLCILCLRCLPAKSEHIRRDCCGSLPYLTAWRVRHFPGNIGDTRGQQWPRTFKLTVDDSWSFYERVRTVRILSEICWICSFCLVCSRVALGGKDFPCRWTIRWSSFELASCLTPLVLQVRRAQKNAAMNNYHAKRNTRTRQHGVFWTRFAKAS